MKYFTLLFIVAATFAFSGTSNAFASTQDEVAIKNQELIAQLMQKIATLQSMLTMNPGNNNPGTQTPRLWGVVGPTTLPAGEAGGWNQDNANRPSEYTYFPVDTLRWTWGDGSPSSNKNFHAYQKPGVYKARLEGLDSNGTVVDTVNFAVKVTKAKKYTLKITKLDTEKEYKIGTEIPVTYTVKNAPDVNIGAWIGFRLINETNNKKFFLTDAWDARGESGNIKLPGSNDYSQDGPLPPGKYRLEMYMYGSDNTNFPSVKSRPFTVLPE